MKKILLTFLLIIFLTIRSFTAHAFIPTSLNQGGTGLATSTPGDILVGTSSASQYTRLPIGASSTCLLSNGSSPLWSSSCGSGGGGSGTVTSVGLSSTNSTITVGSTPVTTSGTITADINLSHSNTWIAGQIFGNSTTTNATSTNIGVTNLTATNVVLTGVTGTTSCLQASTNGVVSGTGAACGSGGGGAVNSVSNGDGTLTIAPTTGSVVAILALGHANTWTGGQTFGNSSTTLAVITNSSTTNATSTNLFTNALSLGATGITYIRSLIDTYLGSPGTGISYSSGVITNTGVTSNVAGTGISVSGATGAVTIGNTGVLSVGGLTGAVSTSSLGLYASSNPNGYTSNTGTVTSVTCGTGLSGGTFTTVGTCANTGVLSIGGLTGAVATSSLGFPSYGYASSTYYFASNPNGYTSNAGTVTSITATSPLTGGTISSSGSIGCQTASGSQAGCLASADWTTFNNKQTAGNYITALTGDVTASGPGSVAATLATVNSNVGTFGSATTSAVITVNGKGLVTAISTTSISAGGTPGGSNQQVQVNNNGAFAGTPTLSVNPVNGYINIGASSTPSALVTINTSTTLSSTTNAFVIASSSNNVVTIDANGDQTNGLASASTTWTVNTVGHEVTGGLTPAVSGGTSSMNSPSNDIAGSINVAGVALTSVTMTFATPYAVAPSCQESDNVLAVATDITSISTTTVIFGFGTGGVTSATLWYRCTGMQ